MRGLGGRPAVVLIAVAIVGQVLFSSYQLYQRNVVNDGRGDLRYSWQMFSGRRG